MAAVVLIGEDAREPHGPLPLDRSVFAFTLEHRAGLPTDVARVVSHLGDAIVLVPLATAVGVWLLWRRQRRVAAVPLIALVLAAITEAIAKQLIDRPRPPATFHLVAEHNAAFPSGHTTAAAALFMAIALVVAPGLDRPYKRIGVVVVSGLVAILVGSARLVLGVHWFTDVAAGWFLGTAWALAVTSIVRPGAR